MNTILTKEFLSKDKWKQIYEKYKHNKDFIKKNCSLSKDINNSIKSQNGEDILLENIFKRIGFTNKHIVDIGAWDGVYLSNTLLFKDKYNCKRLLIEGNITKVKNATIKEKIVHSIVGSNNINTLLKDLPDTFDLLSIDIDGDDYYVLKAMVKKPRVIILEYHTGLPNDFPLVIIENHDTMKSFKDKNKTDKIFRKNGNCHNGYWGANMLAYVNLLKNKGYSFVTSKGDNLIFVLDNEISKLDIKPMDTDYIINNYFQPNNYWGERNKPFDEMSWLIPN